MHTYMVTRGCKDRVDFFINDLQAQFFKYGKDKVVALAVRPVQFWEVVHPKESLQDVLRILFESDYATENLKHCKIGFELLRKALKLKKIPKIDMNVPRRIVHCEDVARYPIGIKDDKEFEEDGPVFKKGEEYL